VYSNVSKLYDIAAGVYDDVMRRCMIVLLRIVLYDDNLLGN
jgi:hypothetical protein